MANTTGTLTQAQLDAVNNGLGSIGTEGDLFYRDATGLQKLAKGTSGQTLKMGGSNAPEWVTVDAPSSTWTKIETAVASTSASLDITGISSTYDTYAIALSDIQSTTNYALLAIRLGDTNGFDSGSSDYDWHVSSVNANPENRNGAGATEIQICHQDGIVNSGNNGYGALFYLHTASDATMVPCISGTGITAGAGGSTRYTHLFAGNHRSNIVCDRIQLFFTTGNIRHGRMTVYGIAHA
tara:strand:+ start:2108 stop:2824 length:717 start_codon:yes stop_codon:yes gene_type:complete